LNAKWGATPSVKIRPRQALGIGILWMRFGKTMSWGIVSSCAVLTRNWFQHEGLRPFGGAIAPAQPG
jgi:hypothetical protein